MGLGLTELLQKTVEMDGSDLFIVAGSEPMVKVHGVLKPLVDEKLSQEDSMRLVTEMYALAHRDLSRMDSNGDDDFSFALSELSRFRCNAYHQRGSFAAACRIISFGLPSPEELRIPPQVIDLVEKRSGMILVTGPAGNGKSTTLACMVDRINSTRKNHIVTIEDPIEFLHRHKMSLVSQREVPTDAATFPGALRAALRQAPDVVMLGEMRDTETIRTAITAAETGHLLLSSLHTQGAAKTIDRIIDSFPASQQAQMRLQLSMVLEAVVSQRLLPTTDGGRVPVFEVMIVNAAIQNLIRDGRTHQIDNAILSGQVQGMISMDQELFRMVREGIITRQVALLYASNPETLAKRI